MRNYSAGIVEKCKDLYISPKKGLRIPLSLLFDIGTYQEQTSYPEVFVRRLSDLALVIHHHMQFEVKEPARRGLPAHSQPPEGAVRAYHP